VSLGVQSAYDNYQFTISLAAFWTSSGKESKESKESLFHPPDKPAFWAPPYSFEPLDHMSI
jgi:hypothetical protein